MPSGSTWTDQSVFTGLNAFQIERKLTRRLSPRQLRNGVEAARATKPQRRHKMARVGRVIDRCGTAMLGLIDRPEPQGPGSHLPRTIIPDRGFRWIRATVDEASNALAGSMGAGKSITSGTNPSCESAAT